jgi:hypothetical protein
LAPVPLTARSYGGRGRYRTKLRGWYLSPDETMAVAEDGRFYLSTVRGSLAARFTGVDVASATPRLEQVVRKLATADRMLNEGKDVADVCRELQVSSRRTTGGATSSAG